MKITKKRNKTKRSSRQHEPLVMPPAFVRPAVMRMAEELEKRLTEKELYCKSNNHEQPYLILHCELIYRSTNSGWQLGNDGKRYPLDVTHKEYFLL